MRPQWEMSEDGLLGQPASEKASTEAELCERTLWTVYAVKVGLSTCRNPAYAFDSAWA